MPLAWPDIHAALVRSSSSHRFRQHFATLRNSHPPLGRFNDPPALLEYLHRGDGPPGQKNAVLRALVRAAQDDDGNAAQTLLLLALWPGLDAVRHRLAGRWRMGRNEAAGELLSRTCTTIAALDLDRVTRIAATVLRNVERDAGRQQRREARRQALQAAIEPDLLPGRETDTGHVPSDWLVRRDLYRLVGPDAGLVARVLLEGETQAEAGAVLGLSEAASRKRYQRAVLRLQETVH